MMAPLFLTYLCLQSVWRYFRQTPSQAFLWDHGDLAHQGVLFFRFYLRNPVGRVVLFDLVFPEALVHLR